MTFLPTCFPDQRPAPYVPGSGYVCAGFGDATGPSQHFPWWLGATAVGIGMLIYFKGDISVLDWFWPAPTCIYASQTGCTRPRPNRRRHR